MPIIKVKKLDEKAQIPTQANEHPAGFDLYASKNVRIPGRGVSVVNTGIALEIDPGYFVQIEERSGVSINTPLSKKAGIIDPDYRGEIKIVMQNMSNFPYDVQEGTKIAQFTVHKRYKFALKEVQEFDATETQRGDKGFGSSDKE